MSVYVPTMGLNTPVVARRYHVKTRFQILISEISKFFMKRILAYQIFFDCLPFVFAFLTFLFLSVIVFSLSL